MPGTILHKVESTGLAPRGEVDEDMRKMSTTMIQKTKTMMSLVGPYVLLVVFLRSTLQRDSSFLRIHEPEAWLDDYVQTIKVHGGTKETAMQSL
jgi:hypothetical protein